MAWYSGAIAFGVIAVIAFFIGPVIIEEVFYDSPSDANSKVSSSSISGMNAGTKVSFVGTVKSAGEEMFSYCALEVSGFNGYVICQNDNYKNGEKVIVTGYVYGYSGNNIVIGSSSLSALAGSITPAQVSRPWWPSLCNMILLLGVVLIIAGAVGMAVAKGKGAMARTQSYSMQSAPPVQPPDQPPDSRKGKKGKSYQKYPSDRPYQGGRYPANDSAAYQAAGLDPDYGYNPPPQTGAYPGYAHSPPAQAGANPAYASGPPPRAGGYPGYASGPAPQAGRYPGYAPSPPRQAINYPGYAAGPPPQYSGYPGYPSGPNPQAGTYPGYGSGQPPQPPDYPEYPPAPAPPAGGHTGFSSDPVPPSGMYQDDGPTQFSPTGIPPAYDTPPNASTGGRSRHRAGQAPRPGTYSGSAADSAPAAALATSCKHCGNLPLTWDSRKNRWYCNQCNKYT